MRTRLVLAVTIAMAGPAHADVDGIQNHPVQLLFMEQPCHKVIEAIDSPATDTPEATFVNMGFMTMAFGFLMGFEATHPGIRGDHETILKRLRADCPPGTETTAFDLLNGYADK